jgi:ribosomal protein L19
VNAETEIMINGALAKLADLKVGDRIRGDVKVIRQGKERRQVVLKVRVDRPEANKPPISP